jgi:hypothetical protein
MDNLIWDENVAVFMEIILHLYYTWSETDLMI